VRWCCFTLTLILATSANAQPVELSVSPRAGQLWLDPALRDFRWDTTGQSRWGVEFATRRGTWSAALSVDRSRTTQSTGIPGELQVPRVKWTQLSLNLRRHRSVGSRLDLHAGVQAGRVFLGWDPEQLTVSAPGVAFPLTIDFEALQSWHYGPQLGLSWNALRAMSLTGQVEYSRFSLDTAFQSGGSVVEETRSFGAWQWSLGLSLRPWPLN
jgi:hypothetical protein